MMGTVVFPGRCSCNEDAVTKGSTAHDPSPAAGTWPASSPGSCLQASSETGSTTCSLAVGRLNPSALYFTAFPSGHPLPQAHHSLPHQLPYFLAAKYADSCLLANICRDSPQNCVRCWQGEGIIFLPAQRHC